MEYHELLLRAEGAIRDVWEARGRVRKDSEDVARDLIDAIFEATDHAIVLEE